ncbi:MAG TPA: hypothetical protein VF997_01195 [Polyangia bacterium]
MRTTDRIPSFAICARCGFRRQLASCKSCGLLVCSDCRGIRECAVCHGERVIAARRAQRRARLKEVGRRVAVVGLVAASGATGLGAAFLPDGPLYVGAYEPMPVELRMVGAAQPVTLETARTWHEPLAFRCFSAAHGVTCCVIAPKE